MNTSVLMVVRNSTFCDTIYDSFIPFSWASLDNSQKQVLPPVPHGDTSQACTVRVPGLYPGSWQRWFRTRCRGRPEALDAAIQLLSRIGVNTNSELQGEVGNPVAALGLLFPWTWTQKCLGEDMLFCAGTGTGTSLSWPPCPKGEDGENDEEEHREQRRCELSPQIEISHPAKASGPKGPPRFFFWGGASPKKPQPI